MVPTAHPEGSLYLSERLGTPLSGLVGGGMTLATVILIGLGLKFFNRPLNPEP
jgi:hypothetical protein